MSDDARTGDPATAHEPAPDELQRLIEAIVDQRAASLVARIADLERRIGGLDSRGGERLPEGPETSWRS